MKKILYSLIILVFVLLLGLGIIANSPWTIRTAAEQFAPQYKISYKQISGNVFSGIKIDALSYDNAVLSESLVFRWNPLALFQKNISITKLHIHKMDTEVLQNLIASFSDVSDANQSKETKTSKEEESFGFKIGINDFLLTLKPFSQLGIGFSQTQLKGKSLVYQSDDIGFEDLTFEVESNITDIALQASMRDKILSLNRCDITDIDTKAVTMLAQAQEANDEKNSSTTTQTKSEDEGGFIPKKIVVEHLNAMILPVSYEVIELEALNLSLEGVHFSLLEKSARQGKITINSNTSLGDILYQGSVEKNEVDGLLTLSGLEKLIKRYNLPLRKEAIQRVVIDTHISQEEIQAATHLEAKSLLDRNESDFNIDIDALGIAAKYDIATGNLLSNSTASLSSPQLSKITLTNHLEKTDRLRYDGKMELGKIVGIDKNLTKPLEDFKISYQGDLESIHADIDAQNIKGHIRSKDMKKLDIHLGTIEEIALKEMIVLPKGLEEARASVAIDMPFSLESNATNVATLKLLSNVAQLDTNLTLGEHLTLDGEILLPKDSLLRSMNEAVKWDALSRLKVDAKLVGDKASAKIGTDKLSLRADYRLDDQNLSGKIALGGLKAEVSGSAQKEIRIKSHIDGIKSVLSALESFYTLELSSPVEGSIDFEAKIEALKSASITLSSPQIVYQADKKKQYKINAIKLKTQIDKEKMTLKNYTLSYDKTKLFATKPSVFSFKDTLVKIEKFWVNDALKFEGDYNLLTQKGKISAKGDRFPIAHEAATLYADIDLVTQLDGNATSVNGILLLDDVRIFYDLLQKSYASDSDIMIIQEMKKKKSSPFMDNLSVNVQIKTKNAMAYKKGPADIAAVLDVTAFKGVNAPLMLLGSLKLPEGGSYLFKKKKFVLKESYVYFTGDINKPLLEIGVDYKAFKHLISIAISGAPSAPSIRFSSSPSLTKEQILSVILFDSEAGAGSHSGDDMMKMMGGAMAKSALSGAGVDVDHLVIGANNSVEVGKKLTDNTTVIYVNGEIPEVQIKYKHSDSFESVVGANEMSSSYDIIYNKDF